MLYPCSRGWFTLVCPYSQLPLCPQAKRDNSGTTSQNIDRFSHGTGSERVVIKITLGTQETSCSNQLRDSLLHKSPLELAKLVCAKDTVPTNGKGSLVISWWIRNLNNFYTHTELTMQQRRCWVITLAHRNLLGDEKYSLSRSLKNAHC